MRHSGNLKLKVIFLFLVLTTALVSQDIIDFTDPAQNLLGFIKTRASLDGQEVVFWWTGSIHSFIPGERGEHLFDFEGFNVARVQKVEQGYILLSREAAFYKDIDSGDILTTWSNPISGQKNSVIQVWNDPVNQRLFLQSRFGPFGITTSILGNDLYWNFEVFLNYPSPLPHSEFPKYSGSEDYQAAELFQYFTRLSDISDQNLVSVPCQISWVRISPWLPWMEMGTRPGYLVYNCHGKKLAKGFADLPSQIREYVLQNHPQFQHAPEQFSEPNETSWTYFKRLLQQGRINQPPSTPRFK